MLSLFSVPVNSSVSDVPQLNDPDGKSLPPVHKYRVVGERRELKRQLNTFLYFVVKTINMYKTSQEEHRLRLHTSFLLALKEAALGLMTLLSYSFHLPSAFSEHLFVRYSDPNLLSWGFCLGFCPRMCPWAWQDRIV